MITYFSICSANYMPLVRTLHSSLVQHETAARFILFLADEIPARLDRRELPFEVVEARELDIPCFADMAMRYDIMEFNTAIKPFCFRRLLAEDPGSRAVYLDPDIFVTAPMPELAEAFDEGAELILTPHALEPLDDGYDPDDRRIMQTGAYNLGFAAIADAPETRRLLDWWADHMRTRCISNLPGGLFVDQKFMDMAPAFVERTKILRHRGYNAAYWNLHERPVRRTQDGFTAGDDRLVFFHFSGVDRHSPGVFSRHQNRYSAAGAGDARHLLDLYKASLAAHDDAWRNVPYAYGRFTCGTPISEPMRRAYRRVHGEPQDAEAGDIFRFDPGFFNAPSEDLADHSGAAVSRLMHEIWRMRADLRANFPLTRAPSRRAYAEWFRTDGAAQHDLPESVVPGSSARVAGAAPCREAEDLAVDPGLPAAVAIAGYLRTESGVGEAVRSKKAALESAGVRVIGKTIRPEGFANLEGQDADDRGDARVLYLHVNADRTPATLASIPERERRGRYRIGYWAWELGILPEPWRAAADGLHEIWVPSRFVAGAVSEAVDRPVTLVPHPVTTPPGDRVAGRRAMGVHDPDTVLVAAVFDTRSFIRRKNPMGAIEAFRRAFPDPEADNVRLVLKSHGPLEDDLARRVFAEAAATPGVIVRHQVFSGSEMADFQEGIDILLSPHRSEGFGLNIAQAMARGKAAVATGWSGNTDFMSAETGILLSYDLRPLAPGDYPFAEGQVWAEPDLDQAAAALARLVREPDERARLGAAAAAHMAEHFSVERIGALSRARLEAIFAATRR